MKYASLFTAALFTSIVLSPSAQTQERLATSILPRVYATFRAVDLDRDGDLTQAERDAVGFTKEDSDAFDLDSDGLWCEGEFVLYYRRLLKRNGKKIDRSLEVEAGRINQAYKDAQDRGLNRAAAQRAADAVRAGTPLAEASQGTAAAETNTSQDVADTPEISSGSASPMEVASEPFLPQRVEIEPEWTGSSVETPETTEDVTPTEAPAEAPAEVRAEVPAEVPAEDQAGTPAEPIFEPQIDPLGVQDTEPAESASDPAAEEAPELSLENSEILETTAEPVATPELESEPAFIVPEFTRPDPVTPSEAKPEATGFETAPEVTPAKTPESSEIESEDEPSIFDESEAVSTYDVFGQPTVETPEPESDAPAEVSETPTEEPLEAPTETTPAETATQQEASTPAEPEHPLTDKELDHLRQEEDAAAVRDRYAFPEIEEPQTEGTESEAPSATQESTPSEAPGGSTEPEKGPENESPEASKTSTPDSGTEETTQAPKTPAQDEKVEAKPEKPLSLWERADRARKLREKRERERQEAEKDAEKPAEKPADAADVSGSEGSK